MDKKITLNLSIEQARFLFATMVHVLMGDGIRDEARPIAEGLGEELAERLAAVGVLK